jgi:O-antigen ligase/polysaccharide polymerase Wzy-like membrane protein
VGTFVQRVAQAPPKEKTALAYKAVVALSILYYARPEDVIPGLSVIPMAKIAGAVALLALVFGMRGNRVLKKWPLELKLLFVMLGHLILTIPFAYWRGGAFNTVFNQFAKGVIVAVLVSMLVGKVSHLRRLLWVQAASLSVMTIASIAAHSGGRMRGVLGGVFENPNDLAINIALNWPLCFGFFLLADKSWKKVLWAGAMLMMVVGVVLTYSRSGFMAIALCGIVSLYEFGLKGKRLHLPILAGAAALLVAIVSPLVGVTPKVWIARMESTVLGKINYSMDRGSWEARKELLDESIDEMIAHPIVGVGPGNFGSYTGTWHVAHNTYTELGAEAGLPALFLFVIILGKSVVNLKRVEKSELYKTDKEIQVFTGAMMASVAAFVIGAFFSDTQYELFPYFMISYTTALYNMACLLPKRQAAGASEKQAGDSSPRQTVKYGESPKSEVVWTR